MSLLQLSERLHRSLLWVIFLVTFLITWVDYAVLFQKLSLPAAVRFTGFVLPPSSLTPQV